MDLKPEQFFMFEKGHARHWKLGDFDTACRRGEAVSANITLPYAAPERLGAVSPPARRRVDGWIPTQGRGFHPCSELEGETLNDSCTKISKHPLEFVV